MRPRFLIFISVVVVLIVALLFWRRPVQPPASVEQPSTAIQATNAPATTASPVTQKAPAPIISLNQPNIVTHKVITPEQAKQGIESANVPVDFYGLVIDQNSNALSGVDVKITVRHWTVPDAVSQQADADAPSLEGITTADGRFELSGATGDVFYLDSVQKDGYEVEPGQRNFSAMSGSFQNPIIFKMWPTNLHENLITGKKSFHIVPDGRPYFVNLTNGTISESGPGDLKVWVKRPAQITYGMRYDWSCEVEVINGAGQTHLNFVWLDAQ